MYYPNPKPTWLQQARYVLPSTNTQCLEIPNPQSLKLSLSHFASSPRATMNKLMIGVKHATLTVTLSNPEPNPEPKCDLDPGFDYEQHTK